MVSNPISLPVRKVKKASVYRQIPSKVKAAGRPKLSCRLGGILFGELFIVEFPVLLTRLPGRLRSCSLQIPSDVSGLSV